MTYYEKKRQIEEYLEIKDRYYERKKFYDNIGEGLTDEEWEKLYEEWEKSVAEQEEKERIEKEALDKWYLKWGLIFGVGIFGFLYVVGQGGIMVVLQNLNDFIGQFFNK